MAKKRSWLAVTRGAARVDFHKGYQQLLYSHLAWPISAVLLLGVGGMLLVRNELAGAWVLLVLLTLSGAFLPLARAVMVGGASFIIVVPLLLMRQATSQLSGDMFLVMMLVPFAPVWLAAARAQQIRATRLHMLLRLPQVRAASDVSDWSLLPRPRAIDYRLQTLLRTAPSTLAIVLKVNFLRLQQARDLLGETQLQQEVLALADALRMLLRSGDIITEDINGQQVLYILAFPNPEAEDSLNAIVRRIAPALHSSGFEVAVAAATFPQDGSRLHAMTWQPVVLP